MMYRFEAFGHQMADVFCQILFGLLLEQQFNLVEEFVLDGWIMGPNFLVTHSVENYLRCGLTGLCRQVNQLLLKKTNFEEYLMYRLVRDKHSKFCQQWSRNGE